MSDQNNPSIIDDFVNMHYVVGYQLPIHPTKYKVKINARKDHRIKMTSHYNLSPTDKCGIPFCCLFPFFQKRKNITDHFHVTEEDSTIELRSSSAFCGLINCIEKGKTFQVIRTVQPYVIMVNPKEVFILSPNQEQPTEEQQTQITDAVSQNDSSPKSLSIEYL